MKRLEQVLRRAWVVMGRTRPRLLLWPGERRSLWESAGVSQQHGAALSSARPPLRLLTAPARVAGLGASEDGSRQREARLGRCAGSEADRDQTGTGAAALAAS